MLYLGCTFVIYDPHFVRNECGYKRIETPPPTPPLPPLHQHHYRHKHQHHRHHNHRRRRHHHQQFFIFRLIHHRLYRGLFLLRIHSRRIKIFTHAKGLLGCRICRSQVTYLQEAKYTKAYTNLLKGFRTVSPSAEAAQIRTLKFKAQTPSSDALLRALYQ